MKSKITQLVKSIILASLLAFVVYFILSFVLSAIFEENPNKDIYISLCMLAIYNFIFYMVHEERRLDTYVKCDDQFTYIKELKSYLLNEGKYLLLIYGICITVVEVSMLISQNNPANPIGVIFAMAFPLMPYIPIPVIRSILSLLLCMIGAGVLVLLRSYKIKNLKE